MNKISKNQFDLKEYQMQYVEMMGIEIISIFSTKEEAMQYIKYKNSRPAYTPSSYYQWADLRATKS